VSGLAVSAVAPAAPGRLGQAASELDLQRYLTALGVWRDRRRGELDALDAAALAAPDSSAYNADVTLSMAVWKAVADRHDEMTAVWDGGRVGQPEREKITTLIWGRVGGGLAVSLPEACRLSDALAGQLSARLSLDPSSADVAAHVRSVRETIERVRDLLAAQPAGPARDKAADTLRRFDERLADVRDRASRGADVGGFLPALELDASHMERDLIVGGAKRREAARDQGRATDLRARLVARGQEAREIARRCIEAVTPAPRLAVPDVTALGPVPTALEGVEAYLARLNKVDRAITMAEDAYGKALAEREDLAGLLEGYRVKAEARGTARRPGAEQLLAAARAALAAKPTPMDDVRRLVEAYTLLVEPGSSLLGAALRGRAGGSSGSGSGATNGSGIPSGSSGTSGSSSTGRSGSAGGRS